MWWLRSTIAAILVMLGCATTSSDLVPPETDLLPPDFQIITARDRQDLDYFLLKMADSQKRPPVQWWVNYRRGRLWQESDPNLSCDLFFRLSLEEKFPLRELSRLRAQEVCETAPVSDTSSPLPDWLLPVERSAQLNTARREHNQAKEFDLLIELSKTSIVGEEKLELTEQALMTAKSMNDQSRIEIALERREKIAPRFIRQVKSSDWLAVAHDLRKAREFSQARVYFLKVIGSKSAKSQAKLSALRGLAQTLKTDRNTSEYLAVLERIVKFTKPPKRAKSEALWRVHHDAIVSLARAEWTDGQIQKAQDRIQSATEKFKGKTPRAELFWLLGRMSEEKGELSQAIERFQMAQTEVKPQTELSEKLSWYLAWNLRKLERWPEAIIALTKGRDESINEFSKARFQYWLGKSLRDGKVDEARGEDELRNLIRLDPLGYYGLLAQYDLGEKIHKVTTPPTRFGTPSRIRDYVDLTVFDWLVALDEKDLARGLLDMAAFRLRKQPETLQDEATWTDILRSYARTGSYLQLYERLGRMDPAQRQSILTHHPDLLFPQPWLPEVKSAAEKVSLPPELLFAIMRQESSFNPRARSQADAFGLMQILPEIAAKAAKQSDVSFSKAEDLFEPEINIPLGAIHIRELWDRFNGEFIPAVASYNASESSIRNWLRARYNGNAVEFIEEIPYEETRGYIRLVMRNMIFYQLMNSTSGEIEFPAWVFKLSAQQ